MTKKPGRTVSIRDELAALKRERIVEAAAALFYDHGYENTTLDQVADRLGANKPFIYNSFESKGQLLAEICSRGIATSLNAVNEALESRASPSDCLRNFAKKFVLAVLNSQKHVMVYMREEKNLLPDDAHRIAAMRRDFDRKLRKVLERGAALGEFNIDDSGMAALAIDGLVSWTIVWFRPGGRLPADKVADGLTKLILALVSVQTLHDAEPKVARRPAARAAQPR